MDKNANITKGAQEIADMLDNSEPLEVVARLESDWLNMTPANFRKLLQQISERDKRNVGADLILDEKGPYKIYVTDAGLISPGIRGICPVNTPVFKSDYRKEEALRKDKHQGLSIEQHP